MNLIENHKGKHMTFDNRTFTECSKRMQRLTPTLPRKFNNNPNVDQEQQEDMTIPSKPYVHSRYPGSDRPIPPPRRYRKVSIALPVTDSMSELSGPGLHEVGNHSISRALSDENSTNREQIDMSTNSLKGSSTEQENFQRGQTLRGSGGGKLIPFLKRPIHQFLHWMSDIANNMEIHSCPP